jgi:uncharacterized membrane protein
MVDSIVGLLVILLLSVGGGVVLVAVTVVNTILISRNTRRIAAIEARLVARATGSDGVENVPAPSFTRAPGDILATKPIHPESRPTPVSPHAPALQPETAPALIADAPAPRPSPDQPAGDSLETRIGAGCLARIGIVAVVIGMGFFLKLAIDYGWVGPGERVLIGVATGLLFLAFGRYLIHRAYHATATILVGGGLAILYFSLYAAFAFYSLIGQGPAFAFMILVTAIAVALSLKFDSRSIALFGLLGGFLTPIMLSTGTNSFVPLCLYLLMLDLAFLALARFKDWKWLNALAWGGTALILAGWAEAHYTRSQYGRTLAWFSAFFTIFWLIAILPRIVRKDPKAGSLSLMTANSLVYFAVVAALTEDWRSLATGTFTLGVAAIHILMASVAARLAPTDRSLSFTTAGLAIFFLTMVFPMQYDDDPVILAWIVESAVLMAIGLRVRRLEFRVGAWVMLAIAAMRLLSYGSAISHDPPSFTLLLNKRFGLIVLLVLAAFGLGALLRRFRETISSFEFRFGRIALLLLANFFVIWGLSAEIRDNFEWRAQRHAQSFFYQHANANERLWKLRSRLNDSILTTEERAAIESELATAERLNEERTKEIDATHLEASRERRRLEHASSAALSILWALYSILMIAVGIATRSSAARLMALALFGVTILKVFLVDLAHLETIYRVVSFIGLGVILIAVSLAYTRFRTRINDFVLSKED